MRTSPMWLYDWNEPCSTAVVKAAWRAPVTPDSRRVGSITFSLNEAAEGDAPRFRGSTTHGGYPLRPDIQEHFSIRGIIASSPYANTEFMRQHDGPALVGVSTI
jgi:hypothetical protein